MPFCKGLVCTNEVSEEGAYCSDPGCQEEKLRKEAELKEREARRATRTQGGARGHRNIGSGLSGGRQRTPEELEAKRKSDEEKKARRKKARKERLDAQPSGLSGVGQKGKSGCEGKGDSKDAQRRRRKRVRRKSRKK